MFCPTSLKIYFNKHAWKQNALFMTSNKMYSRIIASLDGIKKVVWDDDEDGNGIGERHGYSGPR